MPTRQWDHCRRTSSCCLQCSCSAVMTESGSLIRRGLSVFVPLNAKVFLVWVSERAIVTCPSSSMSDQRTPMISPRRQAEAGSTRRNIGRHQMLLADSKTISCWSTVRIFITRFFGTGGSLRVTGFELIKFQIWARLYALEITPAMLRTVLADNGRDFFVLR